jgi:hypothetical protein
MLDANDLAKTYFVAARDEIIERLELREQVLLAGVTAFGVIGGLVVSGKVPGLLTLFPLLSLAFTLVFFRHHFLITDLANYIDAELGPPLGLPKVESPDSEKMPLHWDAWLLAPKGRYTGSAGPGLLRFLRLAGGWGGFCFGGRGSGRGFICKCTTDQAPQ